MRKSILVYILLLAPPAYAAWYQVEAVIFDRIAADSDGELWIRDSGVPNQQNSVELITGIVESNERVPYQSLPKDQYLLQGIYQNLRLSEGYRPLIHIAWQQPTLSGRKARPVRVAKFKDPIVQSGSEVEDKSASEFSEPVIDGSVKVRSTHFLHVDVDIRYYPYDFLTSSAAADGNDRRFADSIEYVRLRETRKIKLKELHYFDHPMFGIILQVSRLRAEE